MISTILMHEFMSLKDVNVLDVREPEEHVYGFIPNAIRIPINSIPSQLTVLDRKRTYYVICESGSRSLVAARYLSDKGFNVVNVLGGMSAYKGELSLEV